MRRSNSREQAPDTRASDTRAPDAGAIEAVAVGLLARREHSTEELKRKLQARGHSCEAVAAVVEKLAGKRLVCDERFVASFVHHHARRGQGPVRIRAELRRRGIAEAQISREIEGAELDWIRLAAQVRLRKFGSARPRAAGERAKQARFLQYRGFDADQIRAALNFDSEGIDFDSVDPDSNFDPGSDLEPRAADPERTDGFS